MKFKEDKVFNYQLDKESASIFGSDIAEIEWNITADGEVIITQYTKAGEHTHHYHLHGAFPSALSTINLDWGTQEIEEFTCTWTYDRWMPGSSPHLLSEQAKHGTDLVKRPKTTEH